MYECCTSLADLEWNRLGVWVRGERWSMQSHLYRRHLHKKTCVRLDRRHDKDCWGYWVRGKESREDSWNISFFKWEKVNKIKKIELQARSRICVSILDNKSVWEEEDDGRRGGHEKQMNYWKRWVFSREDVQPHTHTHTHTHSHSFCIKHISRLTWVTPINSICVVFGWESRSYYIDVNNYFLCPLHSAASAVDVIWYWPTWFNHLKM